jgi:hypothetical protein
MESPAPRDYSRPTAEMISYLKAPKPHADGDPTPEHLDPSELRAQLERQAQDLAKQRQELGELRARLYRRDEELREARTTLGLVASSRVYRLMRALGRWGWLEHRIRRALG